MFCLHADLLFEYSKDLLQALCKAWIWVDSDRFEVGREMATKNGLGELEYFAVVQILGMV